MSLERPKTDEYLEYYGRYINLVPEGNVLELLASQLNTTLELLHPLSEEQAAHRYAPGKWSIKQVLGHMVDTERIFAYRAMSIARSEQAPLPGMEPDDYENASNSDHRTLKDLLEEFELLRRADLLMLKGFGPEASTRLGTASGATVSVRALAYIMAGHELHHRAILQSKYLTQ